MAKHAGVARHPWNWG
ncbi:MAG: hypothetical protein MGU50_02605 [Trichodesmium sp. MAG_R02]|nr:hypothetical protein [Trichodesmium sp. MAG_R02]